MPYKDPNRQREYQRERRAKKRAEWFMGKNCVRCGCTTNLEIDHIDNTTKIHHTIWTWTEQRRLTELAKCQVLCKLCHVVKTRENHEYCSENPTLKQH